MKILRTFAVLAFCGLLAACALFSTKISQIRKSPGDYENHEVTVRGKVSSVTKLPFMEDGVYEVDDGTGTITVVTGGTLPQEGTTVTVRGKVQSALKIGGNSFGIVIMENSSK